MTVQQSQSSKPSISLRFYAVAFAISISFTAFSAWRTWDTYSQLESMSGKHVTLTGHIGRIAQFDEALTMSALMAVTTGESSYEERYDQFDRLLTQEIDSARALLPSARLEQFIGATDQANLELVNMERRAFALTHRGERKEATALLTGDEYKRLKGIYTDGMTRTSDEAKRVIEEDYRHVRFLAILTVALGALCILVLLTAWFLTVRAAREWVTERLESEAALRQSGEQLEARVDQRTAKLNATVATLGSTLQDLKATQTQLIQAEKMASLGQLVASVAHEINTPIGAIKSSGKNIAAALEHTLRELPRVLESLQESDRSLFMALINNAKASAGMHSTRAERALTRETTRQLEEAGIAQARHKAAILVGLHAHAAVQEYLPLLRHPQSDFIFDTASNVATIVSSTDNINVAVDRVAKIVFALKFISRSGHSGEFVEADIKEGLEMVLTIYQSQIRQGVELVRQYDDVPALPCLPDELNQVWTNLVHNALQAMKNQGTLTIGIKAVGEDTVVSVSDTGCGIPETIRDRIFDAFFTTKPAGEGSGLGLDIVKKIVDKHAGRIEVSSVVGTGTVFTVYLPLRRRSVA
jgi:signal transduction histidine kinase